MFVFAEKLVSEVCLCGIGKKKGNSFCFSCYKSLSRKLRRALYRKMGAGYEKAYTDAIGALFESGRITKYTLGFALFIGSLQGEIRKHRDQVVITCEEECWCWDADAFCDKHWEVFYYDPTANSGDKNADDGEADREREVQDPGPDAVQSRS